MSDKIEIGIDSCGLPFVIDGCECSEKSIDSINDPIEEYVPVNHTEIPVSATDTEWTAKMQAVMDSYTGSNEPDVHNNADAVLL